MMSKIKRITQVLFGLDENIFLGAYFLLLKRVYRASFGSFIIPHTWSRVHFYARFLNNGYEAEERELVSTHLRKGDHVLELGACAGIVSCLTAQQIGAGKHCVVEANPHLLPYLYKNRTRNEATFRILGGALSDQKDLLFYLNRNMVGSSSTRATNNECSIMGFPLKWVTERFGPFNTLIMDIEGGEDEFIRNQIPNAPYFNKLIIEFHPAILGSETVSELKTILLESNFKCLESIGDVDYWKRN